MLLAGVDDVPAVVLVASGVLIASLATVKPKSVADVVIKGWIGPGLLRCPQVRRSALHWRVLTPHRGTPTMRRGVQVWHWEVAALVQLLHAPPEGLT
ncbi:hypothetical protein [Amycolatopsis sp. MEPSY49]|uniref:hypothetical protein n=1 Tax=Amycolatopsis sp. MEPSY49 TaxID=3151600 RepID=UPI003EF681D2